jgi:hypothetical protein
MLDRVKKSFYNGARQVKLLASFLAERTKVETSLARQFYETTRLETKLDGYYTDIGRRVADMEEQGEKDIFNDDTVAHLTGEIKKIKRQISDYKKSVQTPKNQ